MPAAAALTLDDRESSPVTHTFAPRGSSTPGSYTFVETGVVPLGEKSLTVRWRRTDTRYHARITLAMPILATDDTVGDVDQYSVPRTGFIDCNFRFDATSTLQERKNAVGIFANALLAGETVIDGVLTGLEGIWG